MAKSKDAFRTISEVAEWLDTPAHVLRFWESKFNQIRPVKRAGGRRYYRPEDMALLGGIKLLLHEQGMTIKGAQKLLREKGVKHVAGLGPSPYDDAPMEVDAAPEPAASADVVSLRPATEETATEPASDPAPAEEPALAERYSALLSARVPGDDEAGPLPSGLRAGLRAIRQGGQHLPQGDLRKITDRLEGLRARLGRG